MAKPLPQTVNTATVFFSIVVALGLPELLGDEFQGKFPSDRWLCFAAALLVILRFLFGSANHLWKQFSEKSLWDSAGKTFQWGTGGSLLWHLFCLIVIGLLIVGMCYSRSVIEFLCLNIVFGGVVSVLSLLVTIPKLKLGLGVFRTTWSATWTAICFIHAIAAWGTKCWYLRESSEPVVASFSRSLVLFVLVLFLLLAADLAFQTWKMAQSKRVGKPPAPDLQSTAQTDSSAAPRQLSSGDRGPEAR